MRDRRLPPDPRCSWHGGCRLRLPSADRAWTGSASTCPTGECRSEPVPDRLARHLAGPLVLVALGAPIREETARRSRLEELPALGSCRVRGGTRRRRPGLLATS